MWGCFGGYGGFGGFGSWGWIGLIVNLVLSIGLLIGLVVLVAWAIRRFNGHLTQTSPVTPANLPAKDLAQVRYAKGEITREEYQQILADLSR